MNRLYKLVTLIHLRRLPYLRLMIFVVLYILPVQVESHTAVREYKVIRVIAEIVMHLIHSSPEETWTGIELGQTSELDGFPMPSIQFPIHCNN